MKTSGNEAMMILAKANEFSKMRKRAKARSY